jgi:transcriptional regulator with GAF, ATPase, and Fis domain
VDIKILLLELARLESSDVILRHVVETLASSEQTALARIWLKDAGDRCETCPDKLLCLDKKTCLHLKASAGRSLSGKENWNQINSSTFGRFPLGVRKVGQIASSGQPIEVTDIKGNEKWAANPAWIKTEKIKSLAGQPLIFQGRILGVLALFVRRRLEAGSLDLLRMVADHLASAIANSRAFETINFLKNRIEAENAILRSEINETSQFKGLIGHSPQMEKIKNLIALVGPTEASVLVEGSSGTGKEIIAREIHLSSRRKDQALIKVNCAAVPQELFESEFFGHAKGAFTGAASERVGLFEAASGGTLFLDEVGEIPLPLQGKLLRAIQEGEYRRVGEEKNRQADVRLVSATNKILSHAVARGSFREDLYYRLNVFPIAVPDLKDRKDDIPLLAEHFLSLAAQKMKKPLPRLTKRQTEALRDYDWPGNVRELKNVLERLIIIGDSASWNLSPIPLPPVVPAAEPPSTGRLDRIMTEAEIRRLERDNLLAALQKTNFRIHGSKGAARLLGLNPNTLVSRLKKMNLSD